jgi:hypothetical protein
MKRAAEEEFLSVVQADEHDNCAGLHPAPPIPLVKPAKASCKSKVVRVRDQMLALSRISSARPRRVAALSSGTGETFYPVFGLTGAGSSRLFGHWSPVRTV